jgi:predicted transcriptional regulator
MQDSSIQQRISELVTEEHKLRTAVQTGAISTDEEQSRLRALEQDLDQCWDLLRRRRAARSNHNDPDSVSARPIDEVEHYQQ